MQLTRQQRAYQTIMPLRKLLLCCLALLTIIAQADSAKSIEYLQLRRLIDGPETGFTKETRLEALEKMAKINDQSGVMWHELAQSRLANKKYDEAITAYQKALSLGGFANKFEAACHYDIACSYSLKGDIENAYTSLDKSMDTGFRDLEHLRTDADLDAMHNDPRWESLAATKDVSKMTRDEAWRYDIALLDREVRRIHYDAYRHFPKIEMDAFVSKLLGDVPKMSDNNLMVEIARYMARLGDGHSSISSASRSDGQTPMLPIQMFWFEEGLFVTAAGPGAQQLTGIQVVAMAGKPIEEIIKLIDPLIARENDQVLRVKAPFYMTLTPVIYGLGLVKESEDVPVTFRNSDGTTATKLIKPALGQPNPEWSTPRDMTAENQPLYMKNRSKPYWFEHLPALKAVYFQYNSVRNDPAENIEKFAERMLKFIDDNDVSRLIVDARWNGGGNSFLNRPFVNGIIGCKKIAGKDGLFIITGRNTFSAAQNFVTDLGRALEPVFVGEPTGSSPNFVGETVRLSLPYSKIRVSISDLYWQRSWPMDDRCWIAPDLPALPTFELFKANRDPSMEAIEAFIATLGG